jgi:hypothetical protein
MGSVYVVQEDSKSEPMKPVLCTDEDKELQLILQNNFNLLPGDQIDPDSPCQWMLVKREMPVPDPSTGSARWSIDFFFVDQSATPTFVECKRYLDTRARREVVGQVLEYAANGQHYWSADDIHAHADATAKENGTSTDEAFRKLQSDVDSVDDFFKEVERRLKAGEVRLVFFLEQAPTELKRLVEFLNRQMNSVEVLLVEARQYRSNGIRVVVPTLFGFTEQIREIKRQISAERDRRTVAVDWESFRANAAQKGLDEQSIAGIKRLYDVSKSLQADIIWGRGTVTGSFSPKWPSICHTAAPFSVYADGKLDMHFASFRTENAKTFGALLAKKMTDAGLALPNDYASIFFTYQPVDWLPKLDRFIEALEDAMRGQQSGAPPTVNQHP